MSEAEHYRAKDRTGFYGKRGAGCLLLARDTKRLLLGLRSESCEEPLTWGVLGGAIDGRESDEVAVRRELQEEAGFTGDVNLIPLYLFKHKSGFRYQNFLGIVDNEFNPKLTWEHKRFEWFDFKDWPYPRHFGLSELINDIDSMDLVSSIIDTL